MRKGGGYGGQAKYSAETFLGMYEKYGGERQMAKRRIYFIKDWSQSKREEECS